MDQLVKKINREEVSRPTILQVFLNADLRGSHNHLILIAKDHELELESLTPNQAVIFVNKRQTLMKCYVAGNTFSFTKRDRIDLAAIQYLPKSFGGGKFDYDLALADSFDERFPESAKVKKAK